MRKVNRRTCLVVAVLTACLSAAPAEATTLFFSTSATSPSEKLSSENATFNVFNGVPFSVYLWADMTSLQHFSGLGHDIVGSNANVARAPGATTYAVDNPVVFEENRWNGIFAGVTTGNILVDDANLVKFGGSSLGAGQEEDPTYDPTMGTYRVARLDLVATAIGTTELRIGVGSGGMLISPSAAINFGFGDAAIAGDDPRRDDSTAVSTLADAVINVHSPWQNPVNALDIDPNGLVEPLDALIAINYLNDHGPIELPTPAPGFEPPPFYDADNDGLIAPLDALLVINFLNDQSQTEHGKSSSSEASLASAWSAAAPIADRGMAGAEAVPEPSTGVLLAGALLAEAVATIAARARRFRRTAAL